MVETVVTDVLTLQSLQHVVDANTRVQNCTNLLGLPTLQETRMSVLELKLVSYHLALRHPRDLSLRHSMVQFVENPINNTTCSLSKHAILP